MEPSILTLLSERAAIYLIPLAAFFVGTAASIAADIHGDSLRKVLGISFIVSFLFIGTALTANSYSVVVGGKTVFKYAYIASPHALFSFLGNMVVGGALAPQLWVTIKTKFFSDNDS